MEAGIYGNDGNGTGIILNWVFIKRRWLAYEKI